MLEVISVSNAVEATNGIKQTVNYKHEIIV